MNPKRPTPRHIIIKMPKVRDKERILKERILKVEQLVMDKGAPIHCQQISQQKFFRPEENGMKNPKS